MDVFEAGSAAVLAFSANVYMNLKISVFAAIIGFGYYGLAHVLGPQAWWRRRQFWADAGRLRRLGCLLIVGASQLVIIDIQRDLH